VHNITNLVSCQSKTYNEFHIIDQTFIKWKQGLKNYPPNRLEIFESSQKNSVGNSHKKLFDNLAIKRDIFQTKTETKEVLDYNSTWSHSPHTTT